MISPSASYVVRALTVMAASRSEEWVLNREIASELSLPPQVLTRILRILAEAGALSSQRGRTVCSDEAACPVHASPWLSTTGSS